MVLRTISCKLMQQSVLIDIFNFDISSSLDKELDEIKCTWISEVSQSHSQKSAAFFILAIDIDVIPLEHLFDDALMVLEHRNCDWSNFPHVRGVDVSSVTQQQINALLPTKASCVVEY